MRIAYKLATVSYFNLLRVASVFNDKAQLWVNGRKGFVEEFNAIEVKEPLIWFHCASLGEFEQGKPVMEAYKSRHPEWLLLVTFFSPSGFEIRKDYELADYVFYLPTESRSNIDLFMATFKPRIAVFVKYEFWYDYMTALAQRNIPLIFISSTFRKNQLFFKPYGYWFLNQLKKVEMFFVQDNESKLLLNEFGITKVEVSGDTRYDRVTDTIKLNEEIKGLENFKDGHKVLIFGSAWAMESDFAVRISKSMPKGWKLIYAPHEINDTKIREFVNAADGKKVLFTELESQSIVDADVLVVNTVGHLARLYKYADVAVIGGGFNDGIHNILEPMAFGLPVYFGPNHEKFIEGNLAIQAGVAEELSDFESFKKSLFVLVENSNLLEIKGDNARLFVEEKQGATKKISYFLNKIGQIISCQIC